MQLFVGNLPWSIDDDQIKEFFSDCGEISEISWIKDRRTGRFKGHGFLTFASEEAANKAAQKNGEDCGGRPIRAEIARPVDESAKKPRKVGRKAAAPGTRVFLGNLPLEAQGDNDKVHAFLKGCGEIVSTEWARGRKNREATYCFVTFATTDEAEKAAAKNDADMDGNAVRAEIAKEKEPRARKPKKERKEAAAEEEEAAAPTSRVFVANIHKDTSEDELKAFFKDCGEVVEVEWARKLRKFRETTFAFLTFGSLKAAQKAAAKNEQEFAGHVLRAELADGSRRARNNNKKEEEGAADNQESGARRGKGKGRGDKPRSKPKAEPAAPGTRVFCGNIALDVDDAALKAFFQNCGEVTNTQWARKGRRRKDAESTFCFVTFSSADAATKAVAKNEADCGGRAIRVELAKDKDE